MSALPDEMWRRIMEIGIESKTLDYRTLCCLSIASRRLRRLAAEDCLWSCLLLSDFPSSGEQSRTGNKQSSPAAVGGKIKGLYKIRYEKDREQKRLAHRRAVLRIESEIEERLRRIQGIELQSSEEKEKMNKTVSELVNLQKARQASVALKVWQPEIIRGKQKQLIHQTDVPVDVRINDLEMELRLCKQQITGFEKALRVEKRRLHEAEEQLASVEYHPMHELSNPVYQTNGHRGRMKKLKHMVTVDKH